MHVDFYEKIWMWAAAGLLVLFVGIMMLTAAGQAVNPPSHVETIDPQTLATNTNFQPGVVLKSDGSATVTVIGEMYDFRPDPIEVPANRPLTFRLTSADVMHGFEVVGTNANAMMIPGYVSQFTIVLKPGEYLIGCNEYCGIMHHNMVGKLIAKE